MSIRFGIRSIFTATLAGLAIGLWLAETGHSATGDWPRFRGPDGAGISPATNLPAQWTDQGLLWKVRLPGRGHSSPVGLNGRVFVTSGDDATALRTVSCFRATDGFRLWEKTFPSSPVRLNRLNSAASSTPAVDEDRLYAYWTTPQEITVLALDHQGSEVWKRSLGPFLSQHGCGTSPVLFQDMVILNNDQDGPSSLLALDRKTGATRWQIHRKKDRVAYSTPCVFRPAAGHPELIFTSSIQGMTSIDPIKGAVNWEYPAAFPFRTVGSPVPVGGLIVATCGEGGIGRRLVAIRPGSRGRPAELAYDHKKAIPYVPTPIGFGDHVFLWGDNGQAGCMQAATGKLLWQEKLADTFMGSPIWVEGRLYCLSNKGVVFVLSASEKFQLLAENPLGEESQATPAVVDNILLLRTATQLFAVGPGNLKPQSAGPPGSGLP